MSLKTVSVLRAREKRLSGKQGYSYRRVLKELKNDYTATPWCYCDILLKMPHTATVSTNQLTRLERRIDSLEKVMRRLLSVMGQDSVRKSDIFQNLYADQKFEKHLKDSLILFKKDRSQFVDPFMTYRE